MAKKSKNANLDFPFFVHLLEFYKSNKRKIRTHYRSITKRFLDYNDPSNSNSFLRQPQFEALEIYVFLKEFLDNAPVHAIFNDWAQKRGNFEGRTLSSEAQLDIFEEESKEQYESIFKAMRSQSRTYPNYIFALTMGVGKTILMATCIFYEFLLANKFPKDNKYCHNVLVFAPDKTVLQSLKEIQTFDLTKVVPPEYINFLISNIKYHFLEDSGATLSILDHSRFNIIISNTQKIILKRQNKEQKPLEKLFNSAKPSYEPQSVYEEYADLYNFDEPEDEASLTTNQRFEKLRRVSQLGIYIDEAHHAFGNKLATDMGLKKSETSLRTTVDELAASLKRAGTQVVACYNYTGTPYVGEKILAEVVYAFGLQEAIDRGYLKRVKINGYSNTKNNEFVELAIADFLEKTANLNPEGILPKLAFFASTIEELEKELKPAVETALTRHNISWNNILVNVGDPKLTTNDEIREFNRLDHPDSKKQFILLVNKGREGWNCRSLFGVALFRQPKSKIFVLQATMRCLRAIGETQHTGHIYLSKANIEILENELEQNFRATIEQVENIGKDRETVTVSVRQQVKIKLQRIRREFKLKERKITAGINLQLNTAPTDKYRLIHTEQEGLNPTSSNIRTEDLTYVRQQYQFSQITLVAEISRYLNKPCLYLEEILANTVEGTDNILRAVNEFNELLYDWIIPRLFKELYDIEQQQTKQEYEVELVKLSKDGYKVTTTPDKMVRYSDLTEEKHQKSFHLDTYCFDSYPEKELFSRLISEQKIKKLYFTGMLTHGQSEFYIQYIDPDSHSIRSYYPDFLFQKDDDTYVIVEVKGDNLIEDPVVQAKKEFAEQMAISNGMTYRIIKGSEATQGIYMDLLA